MLRFGPRNPAPRLYIYIERSRFIRCCTAAYLVSYDGAKFLRDHNNPIWMNVDGNMDDVHNRAAKHANSCLTKRL